MLKLSRFIGDLIGVVLAGNVLVWEILILTDGASVHWITIDMSEGLFSEKCPMARSLADIQLRVKQIFLLLFLFVFLGWL